MNGNKSQPISPEDLSSYLKEDSSFAFEMRVRELFASGRFRFEHGGTYADPHTGVPRQFDLQVDLNLRLWRTPLRLFLAIECKSLSAFSPMLVYRSKRSAYEAGHQLIVTTCGDRDRIFRELEVNIPDFGCTRQTGPYPSICKLNLSPSKSMYPSGEPVGKAIDVVSKDGSGKFRAGDKDVYCRWTQALQSVASMFGKLKGDFCDVKPFIIHWFLPILVIPDDRLFVVDFDDNGTQLGDPKPIDRTSFFVDYALPETSFDGSAFKIRHLEIFTYTALKDFITSVTGDCGRDILEQHINEWCCHKEMSLF